MCTWAGKGELITCGDLWAEGGVLPPPPNTAKRLAKLMDGVLCLGGGSGGSCLGGISWRGRWEAGVVGGEETWPHNISGCHTAFVRQMT